MARIRSVLPVAVPLVLVSALSACSAAPAASPAGPSQVAAAPTALPSVVASPEPSVEPSPTVSPTAESTSPATPDPDRSAKPLPSFDPDELAAYLTSKITLLNLADRDISVDVVYLDPDSDTPFPLGTFALATTDQTTQSVPPGVYRLAFDGIAAKAQTCTIEVGGSDQLTFAAIDGAVAISKAGDAPTTAAELFVATAALCKA